MDVHVVNQLIKWIWLQDALLCILYIGKPFFFQDRGIGNGGMIPFISGSRDWEWWDDSVPGKLKDLDKKGFRVIFFTNQAGIEKLKVKPQEITTKIENIIKKLGIPIFVSNSPLQYFFCIGRK